MKQRIAIIKSSGISFGPRKRQIPANAAKVTDVIKTAKTRLRNMVSTI